MEASPPSPQRTILSLRTIGAILVLVIGFALFRLLPVESWLQNFNQWITTLGPLGFLLFALVYILAVVLFAPASPLTIGAGFAFGLLPGVAVVFAAAWIGAALAFLIARYGARAPLAARLSRNRQFAAIDAAIGAEGTRLVALLRLSPVFPFNLLNYALGLTAVRFSDYLIGSLAMLPGTFLYVYLGHAGRLGLEGAANGSQSRSPIEWAGLLLGLVATAAVMFYVTRIARRALRAKTRPPPTAI